MNPPQKPPQNPPPPGSPPPGGNQPPGNPPKGRSDGKGTNYAGYSTYGDYGTYGYGSGYGAGYGTGYGTGYGGPGGYGGYGNGPGGYSGYYYGYGYGGNQAGGEPAQTRNIRDYLIILRERIWYLILTFLVIFGAFFLYLINATPEFSATASLRVNKVTVSAMQGLPTDPTDQVITPEDFNTRIRLMETDEIVQRVAESLSDDDKRDFLLPFKNGNILDPSVNLVDRLKRARTVTPGRLAYIIQVSVEHPNAQLAAKIADDFARVFIEVNDQRNEERATKAVEVIQNDYNEKKLQIEDLQSQMNALVEKYGQNDLDPQTNTLPAELTALNSTRVTDQGALDTAEEHYNQVKAYQEAVPPKDLWTLSYVAADGHVSSLKAELDNLGVQLSAMSITFGENHPKMKDLRQQIDQTKQELDAACANAAERIKSDYLAAKEKYDASNQHVQDLTNKMQLLQAAQVKYNEIAMEKNGAETLAQSMETTMEDQKEHVREGGESYQVVDPAAGQILQTYPKPLLMIVGGLIVGLMSGVGMAFLVAFLDDRIKSAFDIESYVGLPLIGILPRIAHLSAHEKAQAVASNADRRITEAFRSIYSTLKLNDASKNARVILVTSTIPSEGKSFMTTNLALTYAMHAERVLLIDCDLRMPNIAKSLGKETLEQGLMTHLREGRPFEECIVKDFYPGMDVMPTGGRTNNPTQIFNAREFTDFITRMRQQYDRVFIDSPPLGAVSDALNLLPNVDGVIYVIKFNAVKRKVAKINLSRLMQGNVPVFGAVLNQISLASASYYYTHYYDKSYRNYYMQEEAQQASDAAAAAAPPPPPENKS